MDSKTAAADGTSIAFYFFREAVIGDQGTMAERRNSWNVISALEQLPANEFASEQELIAVYPRLD
jgi:hypothetical protein